MNTITVSSHPGHPVLKVDETLSHREISREVAMRFGLQPNGLPHSWCGGPEKNDSHSQDQPFLFVTVTTASGMPCFTLPSSSTRQEISLAVEKRFGRSVQEGYALPHSWGATSFLPQKLLETMTRGAIIVE